MEKNKPSALQLRQYLEEAGSYDGTMNNNEMLELYKALELSKSTATQDEEQRSIMEDTDVNCRMLEELRENSVLVEDCVAEGSQNTPELFEFSDDDFETSLKQVKAEVTSTAFTPNASETLSDIADAGTSTSGTKRSVDLNGANTFDSIPTTHEPLKKIDLKPVYSAPFYSRPEILALNYSDRVLAIADYHSKLLNAWSSCQKQSTYFAPWGKPIQSSSNFNGSLDKKIVKLNEDSHSIEEENDIELKDEIFTSRAGRQTKRKLYSDNLIDDDFKKKSRPADIKEPAVKKQPNLSLLKNEDIMKRSKLFSGPPTRSERMFDKLLADKPMKQEAEQEIETFKKSLDGSADDNELIDLDSDIADIIHAEEPFQKRRIEPPLHRKAGTKNKPSARGGRGGKRKPKTNVDPLSEATADAYAPLEAVTTTVNNNKIKKGTCPLCSQQFFQDELEAHAATCCETTQSVSSTVRTRSKLNKGSTITCESCDTVFPLSEDYEIHVRECLNRNN